MALKEKEIPENEKVNSIIQEPLIPQENSKVSEEVKHEQEIIEKEPLPKDLSTNTEQTEKNEEDSIKSDPPKQEEKIEKELNNTEEKSLEKAVNNKPIKTDTKQDLVKVESTQKPINIEKEPTSIKEVNSAKTITPVKSSHSFGHNVLKISETIFLIIVALIMIAFTIFAITHADNSKISSGITILGIDVSGLSHEEATEKMSNYLQDSLSKNNIILKHNDFEANIGPEQLETKVNVSVLIDSAFETGSGDNIFSNSFKKINLMFNPVDIKPEMSINKEQLETTLNDISTQLPDAIKQSDYYIDGKNLVVTSGKSGVIIDVPTMSKTVISKLNDLSYINTPIEIVTISKEPDAPNIETIYKEIHKDASDARFDSATRVVYPEENGLDFNITLDEATAMLKEQKDEYTIPLKVLYPNITTNMIGMEAFPDLLSSFSTKYPASNRDRTTNLRLAASKVNGTVVLPGETFSYNSVVGERTIAAGYKEAAIYQDGQVVQRIRRWYLPNIIYFI